MVICHNLGFPRIGAFRETKFNIEKFWKGEISKQELFEVLTKIRKDNWFLQKNKGIDIIPSNDFSAYDHVLDTMCVLGAIPERYKNIEDDLEQYFSMARGNSKKNLTALEMTKWFDTNYHYLVPEFNKTQEFKLISKKPLKEFQEAKDLGIITKPVILGPISFLLLGKKTSDFSRFELLEKLLPVYVQLLSELSNAGAEYIQIDEPYLALDLCDNAKSAYLKTFEYFTNNLGSSFKSKIILGTYFESIAENINLINQNPVWDILHIDLVRASGQLDDILKALPSNKKLSAGLIDGRNIWKNNLQASIDKANYIISKIGSDNLLLAPSCSLIHTPVDLNNEIKLDSKIKNWMAYSVQKLEELKALCDFANNKASKESEEYLNKNIASNQDRKTSELIHIAEVKDRCKNINPKDFQRNQPFNQRQKIQKQILNLGDFPSTTIGSFPQTQEVRAYRAKFKKNEISKEEYNDFLKKETANCVKWQEEIGLDVLVHGEFERTDMVEHFSQFLSGFTSSANGWVQSYGSRCVKPPIIYGDIQRKEPMTLEWITYAQSLTKKYMKGMLTGPITILQWSFVRDDQPRKDTAFQIAFAIRDEVKDLELAGIKIIQIDEAAYQEGSPLKKKLKDDYFKWASEAFRLSASCVKDETQIHTHMCYSEFNHIIKNIADMDADVITIEASRSNMDLLEAFKNFEYPNEIGPGIYDIHSPRVPSVDEMLDLLMKALKYIPKENLWVNPDCGLKTRGWEETKQALINMIEAGKKLKSQTSEKLIKCNSCCNR